MADNLALKILISAKDAASGVLSSLAGTVAKIGVAVAGVGTALAGWAGGTAFAGAVVSAADFEAALDKIQSKTGSSAEEMERLKAAAIEAGAKTAYNATEAAEALSILGAAGLSATESITTLPSVLALAKSEGIGLEQAATLITDAVAVMGLSFADSARATDVMVKAANLSSVSASELGLSLRYAGANARAAGLDIEQTAAVLDVLAASGLRGEQAGTTLRSILDQLSDPASKAREALAALGITSGELTTVLDGLTAAGPAGEAAIRAFGLEAGPGVRALLEGGSAAIADYTAKLRESGGAAEESAKSMSDNLWGALDGLSSAWDTLRMKFVEPLLEPLKREADSLAATLSTWTESAQLEKIRVALGAAFEAGIAQIKALATALLSGIDWSKFANDAAGWADSVSATMKGWAENTKAAIEVGKGALTAMSVAWDVAAGTIRTVAATIAHGLSYPASAIALLAEGAAALGVISDTTAAKVRSAAESLESSAKTNLSAAGQHFREAGESLGLLAEQQETTSKGTQVLASEVGKLPDGYDAAAKALLGLNDATGEATNATAALGETVKDLRTPLEQASQQIAALEIAYQAFMSVGDAQGAARIRSQIEQIKAGLKDTGEESAKAKKAVADAFASLGVTSQAELTQLAANAKAAFETIRNSGTATPLDIQNAFTAYAEQAVAANAGVVSSALEVQAAQLGLTVAATETGVAVAKAAGAQTSAEKASAAAAREYTQAKLEQIAAAEEAEAIADAELAAAEAAEQAAFAAREYSITLEETMERAGASTLALGDYFDIAKAKYQEMFDLLADGQTVWFGKAQLESLREIERTATAAANAAAYLAKQADDLGESLDDLTDQYDAGELGLSEYIASLERLKGAYSDLPDEELEDLTDALADAKEEQQDLTDTALDGLNDWKAKLAEIYGQEVKIQQLAYEEDRLEAELALQEARRNGNAEEIAALEQKIALIDEYYAAKIEEAAQQEAEDALDAAEEAADEASRRAGLSDEERAYEDTLASLKAQLAAAIKSGDSVLKQSILDQIAAEEARHQAVMDNLDAEQDAKNASTSDSATTTSTSSGSGLSGSGSTTGATATTANQGTASTGASYVTNISIEGVLDVNDRTTLDTLARKLKPYLTNLERTGA